MDINLQGEEGREVLTATYVKAIKQANYGAKFCLRRTQATLANISVLKARGGDLAKLVRGLEGEAWGYAQLAASYSAQVHQLITLCGMGWEGEGRGKFLAMVHPLALSAAANAEVAMGLTAHIEVDGEGDEEGEATSE